MNIQFIRNATLVVHYAGVRFLIDPFLAEQGTYPPFTDSVRQDQYNPLVGLPVDVQQLAAVDAVIVTHLHLDHYDARAAEVLSHDVPMFVQNEADAAKVRQDGFKQVTVLDEHTIFQGICLSKTAGEHGRGAILQRTGQVCGVVFQHEQEATLYVAGDTVWYDGVQQALDTYKPQVIVVNGGDNQFVQGGSLVMGKQDIYEVFRAAPQATIISVHMEAVNHWALSREELRAFVTEKGMHGHVLVPEDGECYTL
ncbi:MBL fold metallo-hydrolase [Paenibacillus sp. SGZ-1009]|uniref:MBL fold metallo-hydrolase n=1 Tax=Paenibacillus campi TaxID=3106031 RepID=UPI002AFE805B|nr:MBL fold metallo-hydrolase [Paenibacillus sp. SGZ-1009]